MIRTPLYFRSNILEMTYIIILLSDSSICFQGWGGDLGKSAKYTTPIVELIVARKEKIMNINWTKAELELDHLDAIWRQI